MSKLQCFRIKDYCLASNRHIIRKSIPPKSFKLKKKKRFYNVKKCLGVKLKVYFHCVYDVMHSQTRCSVFSHACIIFVFQKIKLAKFQAKSASSTIEKCLATAVTSHSITSYIQTLCSVLSAAMLYQAPIGFPNGAKKKKKKKMMKMASN